MAAELITPVRHYVLAATSASSGLGGRLGDIDSGIAQKFYLEAVDQFLEKALSLCEQHEAAEEMIVAERVLSQEAKIHEDAMMLWRTLQEVATELEQHLVAEESLPLPLLNRINDAVRTCEERQMLSGKSDAIPDALLMSRAGTKMYPNLVKRVQSLCSLSLHDWERKGRHAARECLEAGEVLAGLQASLVVFKASAAVEYATSLCASDHLPVAQAVPLASRSFATWNVMEFPPSPHVLPVLTDGIRPTCSDLARALRPKSPNAQELLIEAMCQESVIMKHSSAVLDFVYAQLHNEGRDAVFLQEIGRDVCEILRAAAQKEGWAFHASRIAGADGKCAAITAVIARASFDEVDEIEISRGNKFRYFAAARTGKVWMVSVHIPIAQGAKKAFHQESDVEVDFLLALRHRLAGTIVAGGDWNAPLPAVVDRFKLRVDGEYAVGVFAPSAATCLTDTLSGASHLPIDGFVVLS